jgi:hypothetical protein
VCAGARALGCFEGRISFRKGVFGHRDLEGCWLQRRSGRGLESEDNHPARQVLPPG